LVLTFYTLENSRSGRGRNYIPGIVSTNVTADGYWESPVLAGMQEAYENMRDFATTEGWDWVVVSRFSGGAERTVAEFYSVLSVVPRVIPGSVATRRIGRGS